MKEAEKKCELEFGEDTLFVGDKGLFRTGGTCGSLGFLPEERRGEIPDSPQVLPRAHGGPIEDLLHACRHGTVPRSDFPDAAAPLTAFALAGPLAQFAGVGKKLEWEVEQMKCTNLPEINRYVRREYRPGWEVQQISPSREPGTQRRAGSWPFSVAPPKPARVPASPRPGIPH